MYNFILSGLAIAIATEMSFGYKLLYLFIPPYVLIRTFSLISSCYLFKKKIIWSIVSLKNMLFILSWDFLSWVLLTYIVLVIDLTYSVITTHITSIILCIIVWITEAILMQSIILKKIPEFSDIRNNKIKLLIMVLANRIIILALLFALSFVLSSVL